MFIQILYQEFSTIIKFDAEELLFYNNTLYVNERPAS